ncbi:hypothetical protein QP460_000445 [Corynebacterium amycolatum]|uniref:Secreted protein n=1 Tax=Corynebacterium amycolatum TaxID=43765 RepID=A0AAW9ST45_CORAY|nr:hypothetical protein [Corynebacterium amycolatum]MDK7238171.1 hypothetical protein [Corynebacterium amycolatum]MDK7248136.1 hypothetical protein [Corynebacterium amycolatum]
MKFSRSLAAITIGAATVFGAVAASPAIAQAISCPFAPVHKYEAHRFSGSSTSADAFKVWFNGGVYIEPIVETLDLVDLQVNETQVAYAGDIIYKDENGSFWVK